MTNRKWLGNFGATTIQVGAGESTACTLTDLSLKGAIISRPQNWQGSINDTLFLNIELPDGKGIVELYGAVAHLDDQQIGIACEDIDTDSADQLKRVVEMNLGDLAVLNRELEAILKEQ